MRDDIQPEHLMAQLRERVVCYKIRSLERQQQKGMDNRIQQAIDSNIRENRQLRNIQLTLDRDMISTSCRIMLVVWLRGGKSYNKSRQCVIKFCLRLAKSYMNYTQSSPQMGDETQPEHLTAQLRERVVRYKTIT